MMQPSQVQILSAGTTMQLSIVIRIIRHLEQKQKHREKDHRKEVHLRKQRNGKQSKTVGDLQFLDNDF